MQPIHLEGCVVEIDGGRVRRGETEVSLTTTERGLLAYLYAHAGRVVSRDELLEAVWGFSRPVVTRCVDTAIRRLRVKLEVDPASPRHVLKVHGSGYRLDLVGRAPLAPVNTSETDVTTPLGSFIGRRTELARIGRALESGRAVQVVGPPGVGCTRLACEAALRLGGAFDTVHLGPGPGLAVVDDQLIPPGATQVERLVLQPLPPEQAAELFASRAGFPAPAALMDALEGLPLAIEEAAARCAIVSVEELAARPGLLSRTAASAAAWMARVERPALHALGVFADTFDLEAAEAVLGSGAADVLAELMGEGAVLRVGPTARLKLLRRVRAQCTVPSTARRAHLAWAVGFAGRWHRRVKGAESAEAMDALMGALPDLLVAIDTAHAEHADDAGRIAVCLDATLRVRCPAAHLSVLASIQTDGLSPLFRARVLMVRGEGLRMAGRFAEARAALEGAMTAAREAGDALEVAFATGYLATLAHTEDRPDAELGYRRAAELLRELARDGDEAFYLGNLGAWLTDRGRLDEAEPLLVRVLMLRMRGECRRAEASARGRLARLLACRGRHREALRHYSAELDVIRSLGDRRRESQLSNALGLLHADRGELDVAHAWFGRAIELGDASGMGRAAAMATGHLGVLALLQGDADTAERCLRDCVERHWRTEQPERAATARAWLGAIAARCGRGLEAQAEFEEAAVHSQDSADSRALLAVLRGRGDDPCVRDAASRCAEVRVALRVMSAAG
jgi:tetratricopeptide (TPR) repeat protein